MVNDSIGHAAGDRLLIEAAGRILGIVRTSDTVARLGGDEFVVLCPSMETRKEATALAERVRAALSAPYVIEGKEVFVDVSIGITFADDSTTSGADLMREADVAMYRAKQLASSHINVFDSQLEAEVAMRLDLDTALRRAIGRDEMQLKLQPVVRMHDGVVTGFEALIRWQRPGEPLRSPDDFIPLAEDNGVIVDIGRWVRRQAIAILADWSSAGIGSGIMLHRSDTLTAIEREGQAPRSIILGASWHYPTTHDRIVFNYFLAGEKIIGVDQVVYRMGLELLPWKFLAIRGGVVSGPVTSVGRFGIGILTSVVEIDYALVSSVVENRMHTVTVSFPIFTR